MTPLWPANIIAGPARSIAPIVDQPKGRSRYTVATGFGHTMKKGLACASPFIQLVANQGLEPRTCGL